MNLRCRFFTNQICVLFFCLVVNGCAVQKVTHVPGYETLYKDEKSSLAQNTLRLVYFNRYVSDARFSQRDWREYLSQSSGKNYFSSQLDSRSSRVAKQLRSNVNLDTTRPFDQPNIISWVEVDSLAGFGSDAFAQQVYSNASNYILESIDASIESNYVAGGQSSSVEFSGKFCTELQSRLHPNKIRRGAWIGSGEDVTCFINFKHELVRPIHPEDWVPEVITLNPNKQYVLVRTRMANYEAFLYGQELNNSFLFFPAKRTTHKRGRSITTGKATPFMLNRDTIYLFAKPQSGQEASVPVRDWVSGNKLP